MAIPIHDARPIEQNVVAQCDTYYADVSGLEYFVDVRIDAQAQQHELFNAGNASFEFEYYPFTTSFVLTNDKVAPGRITVNGELGQLHAKQQPIQMDMLYILITQCTSLLYNPALSTLELEDES